MSPICISKPCIAQTFDLYDLVLDYPMIRMFLLMRVICIFGGGERDVIESTQLEQHRSNVVQT